MQVSAVQSFIKVLTSNNGRGWDMETPLHSFLEDMYFTLIPINGRGGDADYAQPIGLSPLYFGTFHRAWLFYKFDMTLALS